MKLTNKFDDLDKIITIISKQYCGSIGVESEDLYQDLWVEAIESDFESLPLANVSLRNFANRMYRKKKSKYSESADRFTAFEDVDENFVFQNDDRVFEFDLSTDIFNSILANVSGKEKDYLIVTCYLSGMENLVSEYMKIVSGLTADQQMALFNATKKSIRNDLIAKYVFGYANKESKSFCNILKNLRQTCKKFF